jgi:hypothetical protein
MRNMTTGGNHGCGWMGGKAEGPRKENIRGGGVERRRRGDLCTGEIWSSSTVFFFLFF